MKQIILTAIAAAGLTACAPHDPQKNTGEIHRRADKFNIVVTYTPPMRPHEPHWRKDGEGKAHD